MIVGVDIGGTFTDLVAIDEKTGKQIHHKVASTPSNPALAVIQGLEQMSIDLAETSRLIHGTTVATNTILQRDGAVTALLTTVGHRDVLAIRRGNKPETEVFNLLWESPPPIVPRFLRLDLTERLDSHGRVIEPLDETQLRVALDHLEEMGVEAIAVCFLFSYLNATHESRAKDIIESEYPSMSVSVSHEILPQWREFERTSTTVADAYVKPRMASYLQFLESALRPRGYERDLLIMRSNGGIMTSSKARERPVDTFLSGPAGGVVASSYSGKHAGVDNLITIDMGGTSFDVSLITEGKPSTTSQSFIDDVTPLNIAMLDIRTIGAGGGSIARIDPGGVLKVGPESAGADPGPACYGLGGTLPTVTDANVVLGRIGAQTLLGGEMSIDPDLANKTIEQHIGKPLGIDAVEAAAGIIRVTVANMANAIRAITAEQGVDPRDYAILAGGGGGPLHSCLIAREFGILRVIVPPYPGLLSAGGLILSDLRVETVRSIPIRLERDGTDTLHKLTESTLDEAIEELRREGFDGHPTTSVRFVMRYRGQNWEIDVESQPSRLSVESLSEEFDRTHKQLYGFDLPNHQHEVLAIRVAAIGPTARADDLVPRRSTEERGASGRGPEPRHMRPMWDELVSQYADCPVFFRDDLRTGDTVSGPVTIEGADSAAWVPKGAMAKVDSLGNVDIELKEV